MYLCDFGDDIASCSGQSVFLIEPEEAKIFDYELNHFPELVM